MNLWFVEAIWVYFYRIFMTDTQIGWIDATAFAVGLIAEVPSGALADRFGRDRITKLGIILAAIGMAGQALGGFSTIIVCQSIMMIGFAFMSGTDEALFFEKHKFRENSTEWRKFIIMPFMHSESLVIHKRYLPLFEKLHDDNTLDFENRHKDIIEQFGRYPHRNDILDRESTDEEEAFLQQPNSSF